MTAAVSFQRLCGRSRPGCYFDLSLPSIPAGASDLFRAPANGILVCDMPDCKCLISTVAAPADLSQMMEDSRSKAGQKNGPGNRGHKSKVREENVGAATRGASKPLLGLKPKIGEVAITDGNAGAGRQQAVDRGHQAAEQSGGGREPDSSSLGHLSPLFLAGGRWPPRLSAANLCIPDATAIDLFAWQHFAFRIAAKRGIPPVSTLRHGTKIMFAS
jgi:hypothetical protein